MKNLHCASTDATLVLDNDLLFKTKVSHSGRTIGMSPRMLFELFIFELQESGSSVGGSTEGSPVVGSTVNGLTEGDSVAWFLLLFSSIIVGEVGAASVGSVGLNRR